MNIQFYFEKLHSSEEFQKFSKENPDAYLCSCFFVIDREGKDNKVHLDYFLPKHGRISSFQMETMSEVPVEMIEKRIPEEISGDLEIEFDEVENIVSERMKSENINNKLQKMLFSLQRKDGKDFLFGTVFISMMGMIKVGIELPEMKIIDFEKKSFFDIMKIVKNDN